MHQDSNQDQPASLLSTPYTSRTWRQRYRSGWIGVLLVTLLMWFAVSSLVVPERTVLVLVTFFPVAAVVALVTSLSERGNPVAVFVGSFCGWFLSPMVPWIVEFLGRTRDEAAVPDLWIWTAVPAVFASAVSALIGYVRSA